MTHFRLSDRKMVNITDSDYELTTLRKVISRAAAVSIREKKSNSELLGQIEKLKDENKELQNELDICGSESECSRQFNKGYEQAKAELEDDNEELKAEIDQLKEGHELIYKALRAAEGVSELMTGPEYENVAESVNHYIHEYHKLTDENEKLKELTDEIMNDPTSTHILGCNAYEKFTQAMCELNHDEKWITELKAEIEKLKEQLAASF